MGVGRRGLLRRRRRLAMTEEGEEALLQGSIAGDMAIPRERWGGRGD